MYFLYIKTHNVTGLKYLGHTKRNPYFYKGSGKYWVNHIKKHGYNVNTIILLKTECLHCLSETGLFFSKLFNIVDSNEWANLIPEQGDDIKSINQTGKNLYGLNGKTPNIPSNLAKGRATKKYKLENDEEWAKNYKNSISKGVKRHIEENGCYWSGKQHKPESIEKAKQTFKEIGHQQGNKNSQFGTMWISSLTEQKSKKIKKTDNIPEGWIKGRKFITNTVPQ